MSSTKHLDPLLAVLQDLQGWMNASETAFVIIGGVAASLLGRPRFTQDVDVTVVVDPSKWEQFLASSRQFGFEGRLPNVLQFATLNRVLLIRHVSSGINVDIVLGALPFEEQVVLRAQPMAIGTITIPLPTPEDLVIMKAIAHRPRDAEDIEAVLALHPDLDRRRVLRWVRDFAKVLDSPEFLVDLQAALGRHPRRP